MTNDRSPAALGKLFGGMTGALGGVAVNADGSNINSVALALLNFKLADGSFLIPTPQTVDTSKPIASQGFSVFTQPCHFSEDQVIANMDYVASQKSKLTGRFFLSHSPFQNSTVGYRTILNATLPHLKTAEVFNILQDYACFDFPFAKDVNQGNLYLVRYEAYLMR